MKRMHNKIIRNLMSNSKQRGQETKVEWDNKEKEIFQVQIL